MALTDIQIKALKPQDKKYSVSDGRGLILEVRPNGAKYWIVTVLDKRQGEAEASRQLSRNVDEGSPHQSS